MFDKKAKWSDLTLEEKNELLSKTGEIAREDARKSKNPDASIVYMKDGKMIREYVKTGKIVEIKGEIND